MSERHRSVTTASSEKSEEFRFIPEIEDNGEKRHIEAFPLDNEPSSRLNSTDTSEIKDNRKEKRVEGSPLDNESSNKFNIDIQNDRLQDID